jgi:VanZ family protein
MNPFRNEALSRRAALDAAMLRPRPRPYPPDTNAALRPCLAAPIAPRRRVIIPKQVPSTLATMAALDRVAAWAPVALWAAMIFVLSHVPDLSTGLGTWDYAARKLLHALEYAVLGALCFRALGRPLAAGVLASLYAVSDEVHQSFVDGRTGSPADWAIDTVGVALGIVVLMRVAR